LAKEGYQPALGARPLTRVFEQNVKLQISKEILFGKLAGGGVVHVDFDSDNDKLIVTVTNEGTAIELNADEVTA
jgi:ATP-dependent Clp protease ATP-binding subunit ClpA